MGSWNRMDRLNKRAMSCRCCCFFFISSNIHFSCVNQKKEREEEKKMNEWCQEYKGILYFKCLLHVTANNSFLQTMNHVFSLALFGFWFCLVLFYVRVGFMFWMCVGFVVAAGDGVVSVVRLLLQPSLFWHNSYNSDPTDSYHQA